MKRGVTALTLASLVAVAVASIANGGGSNVTASQLRSGFKKATGQVLVVDRARSNPGHYTGFNLGVQTAARQARYGTFTIFLVSGGDVAADVQRLLVDHTGELAAPAKGGIRWEKGVSLTGTEMWTAKRPYGSNLVIWWTTSSPAKKTDKTWQTLHKALTAITKSA